MTTPLKLNFGLVLLLLCSFFSTPISALTPFEAEVPVKDQSPNARVEALGRALLEVAAKVSGDPSASSNGTVLAARGGVERLMQRYAYRQEIVRENGAPAVRLHLIGSFYPRSINDLLRRAGYAVWGNERPTVQVYLLDGDLALSEEMRAAMTERSERRGMTLRFPGVSTLNLSDPDAQARALVSRPGSYAVFGRVNERIYLTDGKSTEALESSSLDGFSDRLARALIRKVIAAENAPPEAVDVTISGINSALEYTKVQKSLARLSGVTASRIIAVKPGQLQLQITLKGGAAKLLSLTASTFSVVSENPVQLQLN